MIKRRMKKAGRRQSQKKYISEQRLRILTEADLQLILTYILILEAR